MGGNRGRAISKQEKQQALVLLKDANKKGARLKKACELIGISIRTYERWEKSLEDKRSMRVHKPANKLTPEERQKILDICNSKEFQDMSPSQIVPILAERGEYIASESTFYRVLKDFNQLTHRNPSKPRTCSKPKPFTATGPNHVWSWDITYLPTTVRGQFYYLYMFIDIFSRKIIGFEVYETQRDIHASELLSRCYISEKITHTNLVVHSDNGGPMKGTTMLATMRRLGIRSSFSRPHVSDDNPFIESFFRTYKYSPRYPGYFDSLEHARSWSLKFVSWYNNTHRHSGIKFVTPNQKHKGEDVKILSKRVETYKQARAKHPQRWSGKIRDWSPVETVHLNPVSIKPKSTITMAA